MANNKTIKQKSSNGNVRSSTAKSNNSHTKISKSTIWVEKRGITNTLNNSIIDKKIKKNKLEKNFEPSMKMLIRIMDSMTEKGSKSKTNLSRGANLNYTRLVKHVIWLEKKGLVKSTIENARIKVNLTEKGRVFAATITKN
jgi:predicted transcriptional regulator